MSSFQAVRRHQPGYPELLERIADPPRLLYVKGSLPSGPGVAIVGTRRATRYGLGLARTMGAAVGRAGWPVVSGLARGIDAAAHSGCAEAGGTGVAVLGSGIDVWYPAEHRSLGERLLETGGAVVSEYPPGIRPEPWRFPARNRIISGLAAVVVVVEAAERGGALITARLAAEQGREVFALPGDVDRATSMGCNLLIRDGALPILGPVDLVEALELLLGPAPQPSRPDPLPLDLGSGGLTVDEVVTRNGLEAVAVMTRLGRLEAEGRIRLQDGVVTIVG